MKAVRLLVWAAGGALCVGMSLALFHVDQPETIQRRGIIVFAAYFVAITIGVLVWQRRPDNRTGILLTAFPFASVLSEMDWIFWNQAFAVTVAFAAGKLAAPLVAHLILSYPTGRLTSRVDRAFVRARLLLGVAVRPDRFCSSSTRIIRMVAICSSARIAPCQSRTLPGTTSTGSRTSFDWLLLPLVVIFLGLLGRKLWHASPGGRRIILPLWIAAFFLGCAVPRADRALRLAGEFLEELRDGFGS